MILAALTAFSAPARWILMLDAETWAMALTKSDKDVKVIPCQLNNTCLNLSVNWLLNLLFWTLIVEKIIDKVKDTAKSVNHWLANSAFNAWPIRALSVLDCDEISIRDYEIRIVTLMQSSIGCEALPQASTSIDPHRQHWSTPGHGEWLPPRAC